MAKGIIQYTKDIINDSIIGTKTTYSSKKIEELLNGDKFIKTDNILTEKTIGNTQVLSYTNMQGTSGYKFFTICANTWLSFPPLTDTYTSPSKASYQSLILLSVILIFTSSGKLCICAKS